ncbi:zf-HC2 domain-containing protein [Streptomyces sp. JJ38]|uniref:zf-HC2 domain-containing protein n=1 Tax=Streptomyces sp. JJ38 TaxID=2738128 RepID=UPI001C59AADA|nr:zf-HC2 domain-containing protein [Streptomyces sp. JJ38]MBW1600386.1 MDMPI N domain containing protein [Streptomyces sp. JJ38]
MSGPRQPGADGVPGDGREEPPRIPSPRSAADDHEPGPHVPSPRDGSACPPPPPTGPDAARPVPVTEDPVAPLDHSTLKSLLGAWALSACPQNETAAVEEHLTDCAACAEEALRLRDAVGLLQHEENLDLDPLLRARVLEGCLDRRPARIPVPLWAAPYDAETARLDALLRDMGSSEWGAEVRWRWFDGERQRSRTTTVGRVIGRLTAVDGVLAAALGLPDPVPGAPATPGPEREEAYWRTVAGRSPRTVHAPWRAQTHSLVQAASFASGRTGLVVPGSGRPVPDAFLDRAFDCWVHATGIAEAVDYPAQRPAAAHLHRLIDLAARTLPTILADRRRSGLAAPARGLSPTGAAGRSLHLEIEGPGGGHWHIPLDSPGAEGTEETSVAHVALDGLEFCQLAAGHVPPLDAAAGAEGDPEAVRDILLATASLSRP